MAPEGGVYFLGAPATGCPQEVDDDRTRVLFDKTYSEYAGTDQARLVRIAFTTFTRPLDRCS